MAQSSRIQDHAGIILKSYFMDLINQKSFMIRLKIMKGYIREFDFQQVEIIIKRHRSVNIDVPLAQQVEIRAVDDVDSGDHMGKVMQSPEGA